MFQSKEMAVMMVYQTNHPGNNSIFMQIFVSVTIMAAGLVGENALT